MVADELPTWWWTWRLPRDRQGQTTWQAYLELGQFCNFCDVLYIGDQKIMLECEGLERRGQGGEGGSSLIKQ